MDDIKSSHVDKTVNDDFLKWLQDMYGEDGIGTVKAVRGTKHDYLAMILDFSEPGVLKLNMIDYVRQMINDFPYELGKTKCPWSESLFKVDETSKLLDVKRKKIFHTFVMKGMFLCKRARQDIQPAVTFLASRTGESTEQDWTKLLRMLSFLKCTMEDVMVLSADDTQRLYWYVDAAFAVHHDMRSHSGAILSLGGGTVMSGSTKQKINTRSSTEAELVGIDDYLSKILWSKRFIEAQGFMLNGNMVAQDNTSTVRLEVNGRTRAGRRTRHLDIKYFYAYDLNKRNEIICKYCPTDDMLSDYMTKPLVGAKFRKFRNLIMNIPT